MTLETKQCGGPCGEVKPIDAFALVAGNRRRWCNECLTVFGNDAYVESLPPLHRKKYKSHHQSVPTTLTPLGAVNGAAEAPAAPSVTPLFIAAGPYHFGVSSIALIDTSKPGEIEIRLNIHEVGRGVPEALSFTFQGIEAEMFLAALNGVTGRASAEVAHLRETVRRLEAEREAALKLAEELEAKQQKLRAALGI